MWKYLRMKKKKKMMMMMLLYLLFLLFGMSTTVSVSNNNNNNNNNVSLLENCCQQNDLPQSCSGSCFEVALSNNGNIHALHNSCSSSLVEFWRCVQSYVAGFANSSSSSSSSSASSASLSSSSSSSTSEWSGRSCCELSLTSHCKNACLKAKSDHEIESHCNRADGSAVYKCLGKYRDGQRCCKSSSTDQCHASCKALFIQDTPPDTNQVQLAVNQCNDPVAECILVSFPTSPNNLPPRNIECCDHGSKESCSRECREVLGSSLSEEEMVESLTKSCGTPNPADPMWQCFLVKSAKDRSGSSVVDVVGGMDAVKLQCCQRAQRGKCRDLCEKTFGRGWSDSISEFHQVCTNNVQESALNTCLDEAEDRCQLGCSNLTYCTNFNYRPTELFRKCSSGPDQEARKTFRSWKEGVISLPSIFNFDIPVKDVTKCYPEKWHVVACSLHIKPCRSGGGSWICKRDCLDILSTCIDRKRMAVAFSIREICDLLSPTDNPDECISVGSYLTEGHHKSSQQEVTTPCNPNPCGSKDVCLVNRQPCRHSRVFQSHTKNKHKFNAFRLDRIDHVFDDDYRNVCPVQSCKPGCPMGEMVSQLVAPGSLVRLNDPTNQACFKLCQCGYYGNWDNCSKTCNEDGRHQRQCLHSSGMIHDHGTGFSVGCNTCVCNNGESVCTLKFCRMLSFQPAPPYVSYVVPSALVVAGPPCNCTYLYKPVCASNGQTFPNLCLARCHKFETSQLQAGSCQSVDPCSLNPCLSGERCIKNPQICFGGSLLPQNMCPQHKCIKLSSCNPTSSSSSSSTSYCDVTQSRDYNSLCEAAKNNSTNVCSKHCSVGCKVHGKVCAVDGVTYSSECAARCNNLPVDYYSPCNSVAQYHNVTSKVICPRVNCPKRTWTPGCIPTIPPGSCCPICASEIRCLVSHRQALTMSQHHGAITISGLVSTLEALLSVKECTIHAYFSIEAELVLLVAPSNQNPSAVQVEACTKEASHLSSLISTKSPTITSYAQTSILLTADLRNTKRVFMYYSATTSLRPSPPLLLFLSTTVMMMLVVVVNSWPSFRQDLSHTTMS